MKPSVRTLTVALVAVSALAVSQAGANPAPQRVSGGPGASALLRDGVLTMHWQGGSSRIQVPPDYALPAVTTRGQLGGLSHDGRTAVLAYGRREPNGLSRFLIAEHGKLTPLTFRGTPVTFDAIAPRGKAIYLTRRVSATDATRYTVHMWNRVDRTFNPVATKVVFGVDGPEDAGDWEMEGRPLARSTAANGRWTYTLYASPEYPFIHALPLGQGGWAVCIELPESWNDRAGGLSLRAGKNRTVDVLDASGAVVAHADTVNAKLTLTPAA